MKKVFPIVVLAALLAVFAAEGPVASAQTPTPQTPAPTGTPIVDPELSSMQVEIWPEFDKPSILVILRGQIAPPTAVPAAISVRLPVSSGGPVAVASAPSAQSQLTNLKFDQGNGTEFITVNFTSPDRFFHVEFYDPLKTDTPQRTYTYTWPGNFKLDDLSVRLQEPASSSNISTKPDLGPAAPGGDGLNYRSADLGPEDLGKTVPIQISYTKTDSRTTADILGLNTSSQSSSSKSSGGGLPFWSLILAVVAALAVGVIGTTLWYRRRSLAFAGRPAAGRGARRRGADSGGERAEGAAGFCPRCGNRLRADDRFCASCGTPARGS